MRNQLIKKLVDFILPLFIFDVKFNITEDNKPCVRIYTHSNPSSDKFNYEDYPVSGLQDRNLIRLAAMAGLLDLLPKVPEAKLQGFMEYIAAQLRAQFRTGPNGTKVLAFMFAKDKTGDEAARAIGLVKGRRYGKLFFTEVTVNMTSAQLARLNRLGTTYLNVALAGQQKKNFLFSIDQAGNVTFEGVPVHVQIVDPVRPVPTQQMVDSLPF
jgi:hypothetical protein